MLTRIRLRGKSARLLKESSGLARKKIMEHLGFTQPTNEEIDCFVCEEGCVHFEYGYLLLNFTRERFFEIANIFDEVRQEILNEDKLKDWSEDILVEKTI